MTDNRIKEIDHVLEMIRAVDPDDTQTLNEIDARIWCLENGYDFKIIDDPTYKWEFTKGKHVHRTGRFNFGRMEPQYTRSIDAQKALEVEGWFINVFRSGDYDTPYWTCQVVNDITISFRHEAAPTEPLARLYCWLCVMKWEIENNE